MKRGLIILALGLAAAAGAYGLVWQMQKPGTGHHAHSYGKHGADEGHPELEWLRKELRLSDEQMKKVEALHVAYHPVCETLAVKLEKSHRKLAEATGRAAEVTTEMEMALAEHAAVHLECQRAMLKHFYETAATLSLEQSKHYLDKMLPLVFADDSAGGGHHH